MRSRAEVAAAAAGRYDGLFATRTSEGTVRLNHVRGGRGPAVVLLHGWPQTSREWRHVMPMLADAGHDVVAVDLPGLGGSAPLPGGHDTHAAAEAVHALVEELGLGRFHLVGHDVGGMVAFSYALLHPERVAKLALVEAPLPGIGDWDRISTSPMLWHFGFHRSPGLPEALTAGREGEYLGFIFRRDTVVKEAFDAGDVAAYARSYAEPGRMAAGFGYYRAFDASAEKNRALSGRARLAMPVLAVGAEASNGVHQAERVRAVADDVTGLVVEGSGHFVPEERPEILGPALVRFLAPADPGEGAPLPARRTTR